MTSSFEKQAWLVPVPVKQSSFVPFMARDERFNIETNMGAIGAFGCDKRAPKAGSILYADLQTNPDANAPWRLGSGRSGFYRGAYLKGMGRTTLAANWTLSGDEYHHSGHLLPSAALREWFASRYLEAHDAGKTINPCTGLLLKTLDPALRGFGQRGFGRKGLCALDQSVQALTVKPGGFMRYSNLVWMLLNHQPNASFVGRFFEALVQGLRSGTKRAPVPSETAPETVTELLDQSISVGLERFLAFPQQGIHWGSFHNNFTVDCRFLDLEVPLFLGAPTFGLVTNSLEVLSSTKMFPSLCIGLEVFHYVRQMRVIVACLLDRLSFIKDHGIFYKGVEQEFIVAFVAATRRRFSGRHILYSRARLEALVTAHYRRTFSLSGAETKTFATLVKNQYDGYFFGAWRPQAGLKWFRMKRELAPPEPGTRPHLYVPQFLVDRCQPVNDIGATINRALIELGEETSPEAVFRRLALVKWG